MTLDLILWLAVAAGIVAALYGWLETQSITKASAGTDRMKEIAAAIQEGARAYLSRQYRTIAMVGAGAVVVLGAAFWPVWQIPVGFIIGAVLSGAAGFVGMNVSVQANVRTAEASRTSLAGGLRMAFKAGSVTGMLVAGGALFGVSVYYLILTKFMGLEPTSRTVVDSLVGLGFETASLISIFARWGGIPFTKGADVGGDMVGKVEAGIPEDDPRNPATIADNVGDNVGDCAGMAADLFLENLRGDHGRHDGRLILFVKPPPWGCCRARHNREASCATCGRRRGNRRWRREIVVLLGTQPTEA